MMICRLVCALATATLASGCATATPPSPSTGAQALTTGTSATYRRAAAQRRPENPTLVWTPANVALRSQQLAPGVFAVYPDDAARKNAAGIPVATSGGLVVGTDGVLRVVHGAGEYIALAPRALVPTPAWSPTAHFEPYWKPAR